ncbi:putative coil containing protein [Vibrio phage 193E37-1]|nr:putative coil containing protein [Vibrio phage 193E37-1]
MELFAKAVKSGLTFATERGRITPQDLWNLPLTGNNGFNLKTVSRELLKAVKVTQEEDLVTETNSVDASNQLRLEVIKFIIADKKEEKEINEKTLENKQKREQLLKLKAKKQGEAMEELSVEEIDAQLAALNS